MTFYPRKRYHPPTDRAGRSWLCGRRKSDEAEAGE